MAEFDFFGLFPFMNNMSMPATNINDGIRNPWNMASLPGGGLSPSGLPLSSPTGWAEQAKFDYPNRAALDIVGKSPDEIMDAVRSEAANRPDLAESLGKLATQMGAGPMGQAQQKMMQPSPLPQTPSYGGGGYAAPITPLAMMAAIKGGSPLGPAAANPLLMMLARRLGIS